jgi:hypothetical protein
MGQNSFIIDTEKKTVVNNQYRNDTNKSVANKYNIEKIDNNIVRAINEENKTLGTVIPNFRAKIGKIIPNKMHFVRDLIYDDDTINIIRMKISNYISDMYKNYIGIHTQHLWIQNFNIIYKDFIKFINHLFIKNSEISLNELVNGLQIILVVLLLLLGAILVEYKRCLLFQATLQERRA